MVLQPRKEQPVTEHDILLRAKGISKAFTERNGLSKTVLDGLDLEIRRQSLVVIRGENGCGKSTLLRILGLVDQDFEGHLEVFGNQVGGDGPQMSAVDVEDLRARHFGFVFQDDLLLPLLNLQENSELPARIHRLPGSRIKERLDRLQGFIFRPAEIADGVMLRRRASVSAGQRQRVAILRALSHGPELILADEPTASLDSAVKAEVVELFRQLCRAGATIVITSHDSIFRDIGETYELSKGKLKKLEGERERSEEVPARMKLGSVYAPEHRNVDRSSRLRGCPTWLQAKIALREAIGNPLFALMIVAAMAAGLFQLTLLRSIWSGTEEVLDEVINKGSRLDRIVVTAKVQADETTTNGLPSHEVLAGLGGYRRNVPRREILLRVDDSRGRERQETAFGLIFDDPEVEKLELREGEPFKDQQALSVLITERSVERLFGAGAVGEAAIDKRLRIRFRRYVTAAESAGTLPFATDAEMEDVELKAVESAKTLSSGTEAQMEEVEFDFVVRGVLARAEARRNLYLPQGTLFAIATWQLNTGAELKDREGHLELIHVAGGEEPAWERLHVYFDRLSEVIPAAAYFERRGFSIQADIFRYRWVLDTRRYVNWMLGGIVAMIMGIAGLLVISNVVSGIRLKRKEIAILKLMGMKDRDVVSIFVLSVLLCALLGAVVGFGVGSLTVDGLRTYLSANYPGSPLGQVLTSTWAQVGYALLLCSVVTIGFTVAPAWWTARKEAVWKLD